MLVRTIHVVTMKVVRNGHGGHILKLKLPSCTKELFLKSRMSPRYCPDKYYLLWKWERL